MPQVSERVSIACSVDELRRLLSHSPPDWLMPFLRIAAHEGNALATRLGTALHADPGAGAAEPRAVRLTLGAAEAVPGERDAIAFPLEWTTNGYPVLFKHLRCRVTLRARDERTELSIDGTYDPAEATGTGVTDRLLVHRATQGAVRNLLANLRVAIEEMVLSTGR